MSDAGRIAAGKTYRNATFAPSADRAVGDYLVILGVGLLAEYALLGGISLTCTAFTAITALVCIALMAVGSVYDPRRAAGPASRRVPRTLGAWCAALVLLTILDVAGLFNVLDAPQGAQVDHFPAWPATFAFVGGLSLAVRRGVLPQPFGAPDQASTDAGHPVFLAGNLDDVASTLTELRARPVASMDPMGLFLSDAGAGVGAIHGVPVLGKLEDLPEAVDRTGVETVLVAPTSDRRDKALLRRFQAAAADVYLAEPEASATATVPGGLILNRIAARPIAGPGVLAKALVDYGIGGLLTFAALPAMGAIALAVKLESTGPVLFRQTRTGLNGRPITVYKFRTMFHDMRDANANTLTRHNDPRVTRVGAFLRKTSLDELPQLLNVMQGRMSLVGPRPHASGARAGGVLYPDVIETYGARHRVKPGLTGLAQVSGWRGSTDTRRQLEQRVAHDLWYIDNWSLWLDLKVIVKTPFSMMGTNAY